jgi:aldehyde dehydrogenase (NAD+)
MTLQRNANYSRIAPKVELRIGDRVLSASSGGTHRHINPATGDVQSEFLLAGAAEMNAAIEHSAKAFEEWRRWKPGQRRDVLMRLAFLIESNAGEFTRLAVLDNGTPLTQASAGAYFAKAWTAYYAGWADTLDGAVTSTYAQGGDILVPGFRRTATYRTRCFSPMESSARSLRGTVLSSTWE